MNNWNRLLALLDVTLGFPNKIRSYVKKRGQSFDQRTGEHVCATELLAQSRLPAAGKPPREVSRSPTAASTLY
jgi:hypothetical protein